MKDMDSMRRLMVAVERLEDAADKQARQSRELSEGLHEVQAAQAGLGAARQSEEAKLRQAMVALFQEQQQKTETALRPVVGKAWRG